MQITGHIAAVQLFPVLQINAFPAYIPAEQSCFPALPLYSHDFTREKLAGIVLEGETTMQSILEQIRRRKEQCNHDTYLIAIDGRCASGKTTLAQQLSDELNCPVIHMDDFFLRPEQRTAQRYAQPGGNVDRERFLAEVLQPLRTYGKARYQRFDCSSMQLGGWIEIPESKVIIIEGSYCTHPELRSYYDLTVFMDIDPRLQKKRLYERNQEKYPMFLSRWIPLEEHYFSQCMVRENCDLVCTMKDGICTIQQEKQEETEL